MLNRELADSRDRITQLEEDLKISTEREERFEKQYNSEAVQNKALSEMMWKEKEEARDLRLQVAQLEAVKRDLDDRLSR